MPDTCTTLCELHLYVHMYMCSYIYTYVRNYVHNAGTCYIHVRAYVRAGLMLTIEKCSDVNFY